ncbi:MAG: flagellar basal body rod protein FlgB [Pikeienuella sp.]
MSQDIHILAMAKGLAHHATTRQALVTENIANADTSEFRARDVKPFAEIYKGPGKPESGGDSRTASFHPIATRDGHAGYVPTGAQGAPQYAAAAYETHRIEADSSNGNSVSLEDQMARGAEAKMSHEMALGVLKKSMDLIRMTIGRGR